MKKLFSFLSELTKGGINGIRFRESEESGVYEIRFYFDCSTRYVLFKVHEEAFNLSVKDFYEQYIQPALYQTLNEKEMLKYKDFFSGKDS